MNSNLESIKNRLIEKFPDIEMDYDPSQTDTGSSWLDIESENEHYTVEWKPNSGFGLYTNNLNSYGSRPTEIYRNEDVLFKRLLMLLLEKRFEIHMKELRELVGRTQLEISNQLGQQQSSISKFEKRNDVQISTMESFVTALGGTLEVKAHFDDFDLPIYSSKQSTRKIAG